MILALALVAIVFAGAVHLLPQISQAPYGPATSPATLSGADAAQLKITIEGQEKDRYKDLTAYYKEWNGRLAGNFQLEGLAIILAVLLISAKLDAIPVQGIGLSLSGAIVQAFLPLALLYFWLNFGFIFANLIDTRLALFDTAQKMWSGPDALGPGTPRGLLRDHFLLDAWFVAFHSAKSSINEPNMAILNRLILCGFGVFLGAGHAAMFASLINSFEDFGKKSFLKLGYIIYAMILLTFVLASHIQFYRDGHPNYVQYVIFGSAVVLTFVFTSWRYVDPSTTSRLNASTTCCRDVVRSDSQRSSCHKNMDGMTEAPSLGGH